MKDRRHRRKLGQNYLIDPVILFEIERAINPQAQDTFFEIGPGTGALTQSLIGEEIEIVAMDLDEENIKTLQQHYPHSNHQFIHGDILHAPLDFLLKKPHRVVGNLPYNISTQIILKLIQFTPYIGDIHFLVQKEVAHRVVGNLPYNISTQIILKLIQFTPCIGDIHFLVQKEVAHRVCSTHGSKNWGRLGVKIGAFFQTTALFNVPPEAFDIQPKVQSTLMRLIPREAPQITLSQYQDFSAFVDMAFANKRKNINNNLKKLAIDLENLNIDPLARAEELSLEEFMIMFKATC